MDTGDEVLCVAAAHHLGSLYSSDWPMAAAFLVAAGLDGGDLIALASLPATASGWEVDQLVPGALKEAGAAVTTDEQAAEVLARLTARVTPARDYPIVRSLAAVAARRGAYDPGLLLDAYLLEESLDCTCHSSEEADAFEARFRSLPPLRVPPPLARILVRGLHLPRAKEPPH